MGQLTSVSEANQTFAESFDKGELEIPPARNIAVLTCIDARIDPAKALGLEIGDAHVIRTPGEERYASTARIDSRATSAPAVICQPDRSRTVV